jgi:hypothetical protein
MINFIAAFIFTMLALATAFFMGISGSLGFAFIALFVAFICSAISIAVLFINA